MSRGLPILKARELIRVLQKLGFVAVRQKGSHLFLAHPDGRATLVVIHGGEDIGRGLLRQILREIRVSPEEFRTYL